MDGPRINLIKDRNDDLLADSSYILNWWKNYFFLLSNLYRVRNVRQIDYISRAESLVFEASAFESETAVTNV
jgi:hypothetical protein